MRIAGAIISQYALPPRLHLQKIHKSLLAQDCDARRIARPGNQMDSIPVLSPNFPVGIPSLSSIATRRLDIVVSGAFRM